MRKGVTLIELLVVIAIVLMLGAILVGGKSCAVMSIPIVYSEGERTGVVQKFSSKGLVWKTWEGEMRMGGMVTDANGSMVADVFHFSVEKDKTDIVQKVTKAMSSSRRVSLTYQQMVMNGSWTAKTQYLVYDVKFLDQDGNEIPWEHIKDPALRPAPAR